MKRVNLMEGIILLEMNKTYDALTPEDKARVDRSGSLRAKKRRSTIFGDTKRPGAEVKVETIKPDRLDPDAEVVRSVVRRAPWR